MSKSTSYAVFTKHIIWYLGQKCTKNTAALICIDFKIDLSFKSLATSNRHRNRRNRSPPKWDIKHQKEEFYKQVREEEDQGMFENKN